MQRYLLSCEYRGALFYGSQRLWNPGALSFGKVKVLNKSAPMDSLATPRHGRPIVPLQTHAGRNTTHCLGLVNAEHSRIDKNGVAQWPEDCKFGVQDIIEAALYRAFGIPIATSFASRTDTGVNAYGNTFHFDLPARIRSSLPKSRKDVRKKLHDKEPFNRLPTLSYHKLEWNHNIREDEPNVEKPLEAKTVMELLNNTLGSPCLHNYDFEAPTFGGSHSGISINSCVPVPSTLNARFSARRRQYIYRIAIPRKRNTDFGLHIGRPSLFNRDERLYVGRQLNLDSMREAALLLEGIHDFRNFCSPRCSAEDSTKTTVRHLLSLSIVSSYDSALEASGLIAPVGPHQWDFIDIVIDSRSFLYNQIRYMVGFLIAVGLGEIPVSTTKDLLEQPTLSNIYSMVPAHGLFLNSVRYPIYASFSPESIPVRSAPWLFYNEDLDPHDEPYTLKHAIIAEHQPLNDIVYNL